MQPSESIAMSQHILEKLAATNLGDDAEGIFWKTYLDVVRRSAALPPFDPRAIYEEPPAEVIANLRQLPCFRQAYDFDGMKPEEFSNFGAFATTATEFAAATRRTVDFVARALESARSRAA